MSGRAGAGPLAGRVAFVAGGSGLIGRAVARELAGQGASVAVHYRSSDETARALVAELPGAHAAIGGDLDAPGGAAAAVAAAAAALGPVDVLVNTVHASHGIVPVAELGAAELAPQFRSVQTHVDLCAAVVPGMRERAWGRIVYVSGALMTRPYAGFGAYGAAKAAATTLTRYLALEEGRNGITANIVAPGRVVDPADDTALTPERQALSDLLLSRTALGRFPSPDDVARSIGMLTGHGSDALTGQTVWVTGGEPLGA
jgi:NAD(P)-dependent dehydrogenase (short-subunit alcohol dehydrogenase family)